MHCPQLSADRNPGKQQGDGARIQDYTGWYSAWILNISPRQISKTLRDHKDQSLGYASPHNHRDDLASGPRCFSTPITSISGTRDQVSCSKIKKKSRTDKTFDIHSIKPLCEKPLHSALRVNYPAKASQLSGTYCVKNLRCSS
ncbi:hypothetical protein Nepgr_021645 [Nepenthes gracilis]|uniref:Uncharacterized protein n=1 Tax=Nepenthes gracilis TaxID=150966 RepID=A0AAD3SZN2_NEPGR|nr:hypothetical protein Nepgr_021645 [Nepenthes gracilis]